MLNLYKEGFKLHTQALNVLCTVQPPKVTSTRFSHYPAFLGQPSL